MEKTKKIKEVMKFLDKGLYVKIPSEHGSTGILWERLGRDGKTMYIYWQNFGQSANRRNLRDLTWIINTIFGKKGKDFEYRVSNSFYEG